MGTPTKIDSRQTKNRAALSTIGSSANDTLDTILSDIDSVIVTQSGTQTVTNKTFDKLNVESVDDSTTTGSAATLQAADITKGLVRLTNASLVSVSGIPAGASGQFITIENQTGNTITINNDDSGATAANRIYTGSGSNITMSNNATFSFVYDSTAARWMLASGSSSAGSGSGSGKNYLSVYTASTSGGVPNVGNGNAEAGSTTGFSLGTIGTLTNGLPTGSPTFGSGASVNLSLGVVTSGSQIGGSYSFSYASSAATTQGDMMASDAFYIDAEDQGKVLAYKAYYSVPSGASNGNFSGTSSNSFGVAVYDVTNSAWLGLAGQFNFVQNSGVGIATGTFQTAINTAQIRFCFYNVNASSGAITVYLDDLFVGPQISANAPAMSDWQSYTPTYSAGFGTTSGSAAYWRRCGDSVELRGRFTAGTVAGTVATLTLPSGLVSASTVGATELCGVWTTDADTVLNADNVMVARTSSNLINFGVQSTTTGGLSTARTASEMFSTGSVISFFVKVPISGWSSNTVSSADTDTRVIALNAHGATATVSASASNVTWSTTNFDLSGSFDGTTFTVPVSGYYCVDAQLRLTASSVAIGNYFDVLVYKNGVAVDYANFTAQSTSVVFYYPHVISLVQCNAGDTIVIKVTSSATSPSITADSTANKLSIHRLSGPAVVQATESVSCRYGGTSSTASATIGTPNVIIFSTKREDTHNAYNTSTGLFTCPISGKYKVTSFIHATAAALAITNAFDIQIRQNGTAVSAAYWTAYTTSSVERVFTITDEIDCLAEDTLGIYAGQNMSGSALNLDNTTYRTFVLIERIGN